MDDLHDDAALVARARGGDREALGVLLARHYPAALRLCRRLIGAPFEAQDIAQEAALQALLGLGRLREPSRFGPWLLATAANLTRMALRRRQPLSLDALPNEAALVLWPAPAPSPEERQEAREVHDAIVAALGELPPHERDVAVGFFLEGYSYAELAELLGVPVSTVKGRLFKGRRRLQRALGPVAGDVLRPDRRKTKELPMSEGDLVPVMIDSIRASPLNQHRVVVLRESGGPRTLPIWIGPFEADAIALALQGKQPDRPMTHDMALRLLSPLGATVAKIVVSKIVAQTFFAEITLDAGGETHIVDARPSDAFALAVRTGAPVFVARAVMDLAAVVEAPEVSLSVVADLRAGELPTSGAPTGEEAPAERLVAGEVPRLSPLHMPTLSYIGTLLLEEVAPATHFWLADIDWEQRFPTREVQWDNEGPPLTAVRLRAGEQPAWLLLPPEVWAQVTAAARREIEREQQALAQMPKELPET